MTTTHPAQIVYQLRYVEAEEAPVSFGLFATVDAARADAQDLMVAEEDLGCRIPWMSEVSADHDGPEGNWFQACFRSALDECGTIPEQCDVSGEIDFLTVAVDGCTVAVWWIEGHPVKA